MPLKCCQCYKTIACRSRYKILEFLNKRKGEEITVSDLVRLTKLRQPTITFHLNQLKKRGLIKKVKSGKNVICQSCCKCPSCSLTF